MRSRISVYVKNPAAVNSRAASLNLSTSAYITELIDMDAVLGDMTLGLSPDMKQRLAALAAHRDVPVAYIVKQYLVKGLVEDTEHVKIP